MKDHFHVSSAADIGAGQLPAVKERLHHEGFAAGNAVDVDKGESVVHGNAEGHMLLGKFRLEGRHAFCHGHGHLAPAQIVVGQGNAGNIDILNHTVGVNLQQDFAAVFRRFLIIAVPAGHPAELATGSHKDELGVAGNFLFDGAGYFRYGKIRGYEAHDKSSAACYITQFLQICTCQFMAVQIYDFNVLLSIGRSHR